ncbi:MAG: thiol peroxidase [Candidatus Hydrogenedens sp.]|nr:thiol peroxidase [Candidatus Hydrogenedens sp.]
MSNRTTTLKGNPLDLTGPELKVGDAAPDATLRKDLVSDISLSEFAGKARIYSVVPSVDTPICALQTKRFNEEAANLPDVTFITISADLPVALGRFCGAESIDPEKLICLSDHKDTDFGTKYGTLIPALRIECRALFVVDKNDVLQHVEYVPEIAEHPNYNAALACAKSLS